MDNTGQTEHAQYRRGAPAYDDDAGDRIIAALDHLEISVRDQLAAAARMAGRQLEWLMPVVFGDVARGRMIAGKFTTAAPGTLLIVIANSDGVATVHVPEPVPSSPALRISSSAAHRLSGSTSPNTASPTCGARRRLCLTCSFANTAVLREQ